MAWKGWLGGLALLVASGITLGADGILYTARVNAPGTDVRSGPSSDPKLYPTDKLAAGEIVEVVRDRGDGWLEIKPPSRSFSWINARFLKQLGPNVWAVVADESSPVPVYYGSALLNQPPSVESTKVKRGSQVFVIGPSRDGKDLGPLLPIEPPPAEVRYIRAGAVAKTASPSSPVAANATSGAATSAPRADAGPDPDWLNAQKLESEGRIPEAIQAYRDLANAVAKTDYPLSLQCVNRMEYLNNGQRVGPAPGTFTSPAGATTPIKPIPAASGPVQAQLMPRSAEPTSGTTTSTVSSQKQWVGHLRRSWRCVDCRRAYALENAQGELLSYVVPGEGIDLEPYLNSNVELAGKAYYRGDVRSNFMVATSVNPLR
jgi:hypothetical protein